MADLKLVRLTKGDTQDVLINKLNQNFGRILSSGGGTYGSIGQAGSVGNPGPIGPTGDFGPIGVRGNKWIVSNIIPPDDTTGYIEGDHWVVSFEDFSDYELIGGSWVFTGLNLTGTQFFKKLDNILNRDGDDNKNAIIEFTTNPSETTFVISDSLVNSSFGNNQYSKFLISTQGQLGKNILEFSKSEYQDGTSVDAIKHPYFAWEFDSSPDDYSLIWGMTGGGFTFSASDVSMTSQTSDFEISATGPISMESGSSFFLMSRGNLEIDTSSDFILNSSTSSIGATGITLSGSLTINNNSSTVPGLTSGSDSDVGGNLRINYKTPNQLGVNDSEINLVNVRHSSFPDSILEIDGDGESIFKNLSQAYSQNINVSSGSLGPYTSGITGYYIDWSSVSPSHVGSISDRSVSSFNTVILPSTGLTGGGTAGNPYNGVSLLGPYGAGIDSNPLAELIQEGRSFSLTVTGASSQQQYRAVGIGTFSNPTVPFPNPSITTEWKILPVPSTYVTFHVLRLDDVGGTGNWRVFYEANLSSGILYES
jgi:hypothetical protein